MRHSNEQIIRAARKIDADIGDDAVIAHGEWSYQIGSIFVSKEDVEANEAEAKIKALIFKNDPVGGFKTLWRLCAGNRDRAFKLITDLATKHYGFSPSECDIDNALADMVGDGCEIEWTSAV